MTMARRFNIHRGDEVNFTVAESDLDALAKDPDLEGAAAHCPSDGQVLVLHGGRWLDRQE
jgi:hypothetical protein